jgi:hypothetical protein
MQGARVLVSSEFSPFDTTTPLTPAQLEEALRRLEQFFDGLELLPPGETPPATKKAPREWVEGRARDSNFVTAARKRLVEAGLSDKEVEKLPALQIVLLDEKRHYEAERDEVMKLRGLPFWMAEASRKPTPKEESEQWLFSRIGTDYSVIRARARLEKRIAMLRHIEAIRMYAAEQGKLPARLTDIAVPLPLDPLTGKPFLYEVDGHKAILRGSPPRGYEKRAEYNLQYEVTLRQ